MIYKYYPPTSFTYDALQNGYFFFNKVSRQNDPYDATFKLLQANFLLDTLKKQGLPENTEAIMENYATCSFTKIKDNKHMWVLYAKEYSGMVVGFDEKKFLYYIEEYLVRIPLIEVSYVDKPITEEAFEESFELIRPLEDNISYGFAECLTNEKAREGLFLYICCMKEKIPWSLEEELRLISALDVLRRQTFLEKKGVKYLNEGYKIPMPPNCVKEIILGHNCDPASYHIIKDIAEKYGIKEIEQTKFEKPFELKFEKITL